MNRASRPILLVALTLAMLSVACSMPFSGPAELPDDGPPVAVSKESAASFVSKVLQSSQQAAQTQSVRFTVTDEEVTSALSFAADIAAFSQGSQAFEGLEGFDPGALDGQDLPPEVERLRDLGDLLGQFSGEGGGTGSGLLDLRLRLEEPQVYFLASGDMILRGYGRFSRWRFPMRVVVAPSIQADQIELDFVEGQLGAVPLPAFIFDPLGGLFGQALLAGQDYAEITELTVTEGALTFAGQVNLENFQGN
ncbi:MAG: hypothetical protein ACLFWD_08665 [Anaerolineales bacterium]